MNKDLPYDNQAFLFGSEAEPGQETDAASRDSSTFDFEGFLAGSALPQHGASQPYELGWTPTVMFDRPSGLQQPASSYQSNPVYDVRNL